MSNELITTATVTLKVKRQRPKSRPARWAATLERARTAFNDLHDAMSELGDLKDEYQEWRDNLPENMESGATAEKLDEICNLDFDILDEVESLLDEAEGADLPRGFGRD